MRTFTLNSSPSRAIGLGVARARFHGQRDNIGDQGFEIECGFGWEAEQIWVMGSSYQSGLQPIRGPFLRARATDCKHYDELIT